MFSFTRYNRISINTSIIFRIKFWFKKDNKFDQLIYNKYKTLHFLAIDGLLDNWKYDYKECLALILIIDQFSRNMFRNNHKSYDYDHISLKFLRFGLKKSYLNKYKSLNEKFFFILPLIHSEKLKDQKLAISLFNKHLSNHPKKKEINKFFKRHEEIVKIFGRFPHRNKILKRKIEKN